MEKQLPNNWVETELETVFNLVYGRGVSVGSLQEDGYDVYGANGIIGKYNKFIYEDPKIIISCRGAASGVIHKTNPKSFVTSNSIVLDPAVSSKLNIVFFKYLMSYIDKSSVITGTAQSQITIQLLKDLIIMVPPLAEQERIAVKLDALFGQLDSVRGAMSRIPTLLANLRQQILTHAVTGKLTHEWRQDKNLEEWRTERADECCIKVQSGGTPKGGDFSTVGIPFLKVYNIVQNKIDFEYQPQYVTNEIQNTQIKKSITYPGDVIMNIVGPPLNKIAIIPTTYSEWNLNQAITLFRTKDYLLKEYLYYFFCEGSSVNSLINETRGVVGQVNISLSQCRAFVINIPPKLEQEEIVRRVKSLFDKLDSIENQYRTLKQKIDALSQAILHKAFKGELVQQLPTDGNAADLLCEIEQLKKSLKKK